jgi:hypothetical protein
MSIIITGDLDWSGALVLFLTALDGGPAADVAGYAFTTSGDVEYSAEVPEPGLPANRLLGVYRCVAKTAGVVPAGSGYVTIGADTEAVRIRSEGAAELDASTSAKLARIEAVVSGTLSGAGTSTEIFVGPSATVTVTVDADGNRSAVGVT